MARASRTLPTLAVLACLLLMAADVEGLGGPCNYVGARCCEYIYSGSLYCVGGLTCYSYYGRCVYWGGRKLQMALTPTESATAGIKTP